LVFSYNKILVPYDGSKPSENALQQAMQIVNDLLKCGSETTDPMQGIQIIQQDEEMKISKEIIY